MGNNTQPPSNSPLLPPSPPPKFEWPAKGQDLPRLDWPAYVKLLANEIDRELGGETGHYLGNWLTALSIQAELLSATSPSEQDQLSQAEADRMSAWLEALQQEAAQPGAWVMLQPDPDHASQVDLRDDDATGGWGGHESQPDFDEFDTGPIRGWIPCDGEDETFLN